MTRKTPSATAIAARPSLRKRALEPHDTKITPEACNLHNTRAREAAMMNVNASFTSHGNFAAHSRSIESASCDTREDGAAAPSFTLAQTIARVTFTVAFMMGMAALFGLQMYATLR